MPRQGSFPSPKVLKLISLGWSNHRKNLYLDVHTPSPILKVPYQTLPLTEIPQIPHFRTNLSFLLQPGNFLWLGLCFSFLDPFPLTQFLRLHFPLLPNIPPYLPKFPQEFRSSLSPSFRFILENSLSHTSGYVSLK